MHLSLPAFEYKVKKQEKGSAKKTGKTSENP